MNAEDAAEWHIRRLAQEDVPLVRALMLDVISRLPDPDHFAMDDEAYLQRQVEEQGEIFGAFWQDLLVAYSVLALPGTSDKNLAREFGVPEAELPYVGVLDATVVHESARGRGLQRLFHEVREQRARERGCLYVYATVHPDNRPSLLNLEAAGFVRQFTRLMYGGKLRHCYAKRL